MRGRTPLVATALAALVVVGCGLGPGASTEGTATVTVTRDYGAVELRSAEVAEPTETDTVMRVLDREAEIETRYGGGFVQSIDGVAGGFDDARSFDWFFYVNGVESPSGAADTRVLGGDRIWWDHRDWTEAMRVPAVVGAWPEPFLQASAGADRLPVRVECAGDPGPCQATREALADEGVSAAVVDLGAERADSAMRIVVGPWAEIHDDAAARLIGQGPAASGVFARFAGERLETLDERGQAQAPAGLDAGILAATRDGDEPPTWVLTGGSPAGVAAAAELLDTEDLTDRYAVAIDGGEAIPLPVPRQGP